MSGTPTSSPPVGKRSADIPMTLICTKSQYGIDLPLNAKLEIDGQEMTVLGLAKTDVKDGQVWQWWICGTS